MSLNACITQQSLINFMNDSSLILSVEERRNGEKFLTTRKSNQLTIIEKITRFFGAGKTNLLTVTNFLNNEGKIHLNALLIKKGEYLRVKSELSQNQRRDSSLYDVDQQNNEQNQQVSEVDSIIVNIDLRLNEITESIKILIKKIENYNNKIARCLGKARLSFTASRLIKYIVPAIDPSLQKLQAEFHTVPL